MKDSEIVKSAAILVSIAERGSDVDECERSLDELERLLDTAGGSVFARVLQVKDSFDPRTCIGSGKVKEISDVRDEFLVQFYSTEQPPKNVLLDAMPMDEDIDAYFAREVLPYAPDAWIDKSKTKVGYEIPFTRYFYKYTPPRKSEDIMAEIMTLESELDALLKGVSK